MLALPLAVAPTVLLLTAGILLIALELNRPGLILPGCLGLAGSLVAIASIAHCPHPAAPLFLLVCALACSAFQLTQGTQRLIALTAFLYLASFGLFTRHMSSVIPPWLALLTGACALTLSFVISWLAKVAARARLNKSH
jgi:membrane-bound ClpP family serine protease